MESFSCALAAHDSDFRRWTTDGQPQILPELSNFYCLPGRAGGSPGVTRSATRRITTLRKPLEQLSATFDARAESVADNLMFRATFERHRCIVRASGCYE